MAQLTENILTHVIHDAAELCPQVTAVGLVGSFARGEQAHGSDVDLLVKSDSSVKFNKVLESFGEYVRHVLDYQFNKRLEVIRYDFAVDRASRTPNENEIWFYREGFEQMLKEVRWIYEKR